LGFNASASASPLTGEAVRVGWAFHPRMTVPAIERQGIMKNAISRRIASQSLGMAALGLTMLGCAISHGPALNQGEPERLNVIFIMSDDLSTALSGYGHPQCKTPNLDRLAERGVVFTRAYCQYPVCGPSRSSIMTGHYPTALGETSGMYRAAPNDEVPPSGGFRDRIPDLVTMPQHFRAHGYNAVRVGKMFHMGIPGEIVNGTSRYEDPASWTSTFNIQAPEHNAPGDKEDLTPLVTHEGMDFVTVQADGGAEIHADAKSADLAIQLMRELPQPFFLGVGMVRPHVPLVAPREYFDRYPWQDMELPFVPEDDLGDVPEAAQTQTNAVKYGMNEEQMRKALAGYYAAITFMDTQVGRILDEVERLGLDDNTVIVFVSDHGYNLGEHTTWQKLSLFEDTTRVPLIIATPWTTGGHSSELVELIDLYPTLSDVAGIPVRSDLPGESLRPVLEDPANGRTARSMVYTISREEAESVRTDRYRLNVYKDGLEGIELYDHDNDPGEFVNLAVQPGHEATVARMYDVLLQARERAAPIYE
jgi:iduronate 2-sulfatase